MQDSGPRRKLSMFAMNAKPFDKGTIIFPHIFRTAVPLFTIFGKNFPHLSYNTTAIKWFTTPKLRKYITP